MIASTIVPFGQWPSPVTGLDVAAADAPVEWVDFVGHRVGWVETRPHDKGRGALMAFDGEHTTELLPGRNVRSRIIEYGARPWAPVGADGVVFSDADGPVYRLHPDGEIRPLTPVTETIRYGDFAIWRNSEVWCLREDGVRRALVAIPLDCSAAGDAGRIRVLAATHRFLTGPRLSPDGNRVAWLGWDHPRLPWEGTEAMVATVRADGTLSEPRVWIGGPGESIAHVEWSPSTSDTLLAITDRSGWWNPVAVRSDGSVTALGPLPHDFAEALWRIGWRWCAPLSDGRLAVVHGDGEMSLGVIDAGRLTDIASPFTDWSSVATDGTRIAAVAGGPGHRRGVVLVDPDSGGWRIIRMREAHDEFAATPIVRAFADDADRPIHAYLHPPFHPEVAGPPGERPPCVVFVHGGPTYRSHLTRRQEITFFTSRGFLVVDVQHGGSTGRGRAYRERLNGLWGVLDVADCAAVVRALITEGTIDPHRIAIRGGSAGGWTAAVALTAPDDLYAAGCGYFPVLDLPSWYGSGTHDFESHYLLSMVGDPVRDAAEFRRRSPSHRGADLRAPLLIQQGLADTICRPEQVELFRARVPDDLVTCVFFEGEGHGFRKAATIDASLTRELRHYQDVFCGVREAAGRGEA
ncbi:MAG TPA: prolyl oligopeptidase family serine peptidase [Candidatus Limnocylindrales bacterium]|nr:prolyl oligopeptidase family serine peptidase [Candidatus Limnocylindrales bacterium]